MNNFLKALLFVVVAIGGIIASTLVTNHFKEPVKVECDCTTKHFVETECDWLRQEILASDLEDIFEGEEKEESQCSNLTEEDVKRILQQNFTDTFQMLLAIDDAMGKPRLVPILQYYCK